MSAWPDEEQTIPLGMDKPAAAAGFTGTGWEEEERTVPLEMTAPTGFSGTVWEEDDKTLAIPVPETPSLSGSAWGDYDTAFQTARETRLPETEEFTPFTNITFEGGNMILPGEAEILKASLPKDQLEKVLEGVRTGKLTLEIRRLPEGTVIEEPAAQTAPEPAPMPQPAVNITPDTMTAAQPAPMQQPAVNITHDMAPIPPQTTIVYDPAAQPAAAGAPEATPGPIPTIYTTPSAAAGAAAALLSTPTYRHVDIPHTQMTPDVMPEKAVQEPPVETPTSSFPTDPDFLEWNFGMSAVTKEEAPRVLEGRTNVGGVETDNRLIRPWEPEKLEHLESPTASGNVVSAIESVLKPREIPQPKPVEKTVDKAVENAAQKAPVPAGNTVPKEAPRKKKKPEKKKRAFNLRFDGAHLHFSINFGGDDNK